MDLRALRTRRGPAAAGALGLALVLLATMSAFFLDTLP